MPGHSLLNQRGNDVDAGTRSLNGLSWLTFLIAAMQAGFGPFVAVRLTEAGWTDASIGLVLSASTVAAMVAQVPSGAVIDRLGSNRRLAAAAIVASVAALLLLVAAPLFGLVLAAEIVQGGAGVGLAIAIAAITLSVARQDRLGERLGRNVRYGAMGAALGAGLFGLVGSLVAGRAVFLLAAACGPPALLALRAIGPEDLAQAKLRTGHHTAPPPHRRRGRPVPALRLLRDRRLLALLGVAALFQLGNASLLPLAAGSFARQTGRHADLITAAAVTVPQLLTALLSPRVGLWAQTHGRRIVLMLGLVALPLRGLAFAASPSVAITFAAQTLDGVSAASFGVLLPLIVADITHRGGRFNLALGMTGLAGGLGATLSTALAGRIADMAGLPAAFLALAAVGCGAVLTVWVFLPETAHLPVAHQEHHA